MSVRIENGHNARQNKSRGASCPPGRERHGVPELRLHLDSGANKDHRREGVNSFESSQRSRTRNDYYVTNVTCRCGRVEGEHVEKAKRLIHSVMFVVGYYVKFERFGAQPPRRTHFLLAWCSASGLRLTSSPDSNWIPTRHTLLWQEWRAKPLHGDWVVIASSRRW